MKQAHETKLNKHLESIVAETEEMYRKAEAREIVELVGEIEMDAAMSSRSGQKISRKARRMFSREVATEGKKFAKNIIKPKPKWVPMWLWFRGMKIFIKVKN